MPHSAAWDPDHLASGSWDACKDGIERWCREREMADPVVKFFILVAGHEYTDKSLAFAPMCTHRAQEQIDALNRAATEKSEGALVIPPATLRFLRFNFSTGQISVIEYSLAVNGGKTLSLDEKSWKPLSEIKDSTHYNPKSFVTDRTLRKILESDYETIGHQYPSLKHSSTQNDIMSITDVYESIQAAPDGSVVEFSIFSHGYDGGPILVNSDEADATPDDERDPLDKDGRWDKDFGPDMGDGSGATTPRDNFVSSFDKKGMIQIWGCNASPAPNKVIYQAFSKRRNQDDALGKALAAHKPISNSQLIEFEFSGDDKTEKEFREKHYADDKFFPHKPDGKPDPSIEEFTRTFLQVRQYIARATRDSYAYQAALNTGIKVLGALPGMEGDDERTKRYNLMQVCRKQSPNPKKIDPDRLECPNGYQSRMEFYQEPNYIGIDISDRGYGIFTKSAVDNVKKILAIMA